MRVKVKRLTFKKMKRSWGKQSQIREIIFGKEVQWWYFFINQTKPKEEIFRKYSLFGKSLNNTLHTSQKKEKEKKCHA